MSDLHAFDSGKVDDHRRPSFYDMGQTEAAGDNPIQDLKEFLQKEQTIQADYLLFCGDLADRAYPPAAERGWKELQEIMKLLKSRELLATVGNHDLDSRHSYNDHDAKGCLLELVPNFPIHNAEENNHFWTHHFIIREPHEWPVRFVVVNSSGYHGEGGPNGTPQKEFERGRVSKRTLTRLLKELAVRPRKIVNVAIIHHHPQKQSELKLGDYDDMQGGYDFLQALDPIAQGPWLVIHGHKHFPKISYAQGSSTAPVVFSSGSCAAIPYPEIMSRAGQQVYLLTLDLTKPDATNTYGTFRSWDWAPGRGWDVAQRRSGLPAQGGFGNRTDVGALAASVAEKYPTGSLPWQNVQSEFPSLRYLIPADLDSLLQMLKNQFGFSFEINREGLPILFTR